jgi:RimJ/RimL family protein N-acetyltransferase
MLRRWAPADLPDLVAAGADPVVWRFRYSIPRDRHEAVKWLSRLEPDRRAGARLELAIAVADTPEAAVGSISLTEIQHRTAMVRYWLAPEARGRGLATRGVGLLAAWAFHWLGMARLGLHIEPENVASQRVADRCGFVQEGRLRSHGETRDGQRVDVLIYGLLPGELDAFAFKTSPPREAT